MPPEPAQPNGPTRADSWLRDHRTAVLLALVILSAVLRGVYFIQLNAGPCLWQHRWDQSDMQFFHAWAGHIAEGDVLTDRVLHPFHGWHRRVAEDYLARYPEERQRLVDSATADGVTGRSAEQLLWDEWYGGKQFHQEPLYPYLLAVTRVICGSDVRWVFAWQLGLGVLTNVLIYVLARRFFGDLAGVCAASLAALCGPLLFYELVLLRAAPLTCAGLAAAWGVACADERRTLRAWGLAGMLCGLAMLLKSTLILFPLLTLAVLAWERRAELQSLGRSAGGLLLGVALMMAPLMVRNIAVGCPPLSSSSVGAVGFILTNAVEWRSSLGARRLAYDRLPEIMHDTGGGTGGVILATLSTHTVGSYVRQLWSKFASVLHWYEMPNNANFYYYAERAPILNWLPVRFLLICPLGVLGAFIGLGTWQRSWPAYALGVDLLIPLLAFGTLSRYRIGLTALLCLFAGLAMARSVVWLVDRRYGVLAIAGVVALLMAAWIGRPLPVNYPRIHPADYLAPVEYYYRPLAEAAENAEDWDEAARIMEAALACQPRRIRRLRASRPLKTRGDKALARRFSRLYLAQADYLERAGATDDATRSRQRGTFLKRMGR